MQRDISVAFQGGGAKLICLIATAHALSELQSDGLVRVKAVSGSSAGSLAAFLLASDADFAGVREAIRRREAEIRSAFPALSKIEFKFKLALYYLFGRTIYSQNRFSKILSDILGDVGIKSTDQLSRYCTGSELSVVVSDVYQGRSRIIALSESVDTALRTSCALPIVFASHRLSDGGQSVDGGMFDNLPTDVLMSASDVETPVFAIGFPSETLPFAGSAGEYIYSLVSSMISHKVFSSRQLIGDDMVFEIKTDLATLDFHQMIDVATGKSYDEIKRAAENFFRSWLAGNDSFADPGSKYKGSRPLSKLRSIERTTVSYLDRQLKECPGRNSYARMRVNAHSLEHKEQADEIVTEHCAVIPTDFALPGFLLTMIAGSGYTLSVECEARLNGSEGELIPHSTILIEGDDFYNESQAGPAQKVVLLFHQQPGYFSGKSIYIVKKELRYGFMAELRDTKYDYLAFRSAYMPADEVSIQLNVPRKFRALEVEWQRLGSDGAAPEALTAAETLIPSGYVALKARLPNVPVGTRLKGSFRLP